MNKLFSVGVKDFVKGLVVAVLSGVLTYVYGAIQGGTFAVDWNQVGVVAVTAGLSYIIKNYISDENGKVGGLI